jgi:hypothetical protein
MYSVNTITNKIEQKNEYGGDYDKRNKNNLIVLDVWEIKMFLIINNTN